MERRNRWLVSAIAIPAVLAAAPSVLAAQTYASTRLETAQGTGKATKGASSAAKFVTLSVRDSSVLYIVREIIRQSGVGASFDPKLPQFQKRVSVIVTRATVQDAITAALRETSLLATFTADGATLVIRPRDERRAQDSIPRDNGKVSGTVFDSATNQPIANAIVSLTGMDQKVTVRQGRFTLTQVPLGRQILSFKAFGYKVKTFTTDITENTPSVKIFLSPTSLVLTEVLTTATGNMSRAQVGNDITILKVDSIMRTAPISSVTDLLTARVPGVIVQRTSGSPGDPARIRIRGTSSINANNDPIIIIDGIRMYHQQSDERNVNKSSNTGSTSGPRTYDTPSSLDQIDPNSIETIEILKGPSAAAMYGSDAATGVIVIKTKRGRPGPPRMDVSVSTGMEYIPGPWPESQYKWVTPAVGGGPMLCTGFCGDARVDSIVMFQALNNPRLTALGRGSTLKASVTVSGGSETLGYSITGSTMDRRGVLKLPAFEQERYLRFQGEPAPDWMRRPDQYKTYSMVGTLTATFDTVNSIFVKSALDNSRQTRTSMSMKGLSAVNQLQRMYVDVSQLNETSILINPYERNITETITLRNSAILQYVPWSWFSTNTTVGANTILQTGQISLASGLLTGDEAGGSLTEKSNRTAEVTAALRSTLFPNRKVSLRTGVDFTRSRSNDLRGTLRGIPENVTDPSMGVDSTRNEVLRSTFERKSSGWYLEPIFNVTSNFFVIPGFRIDENGLAGSNAGFMKLPKMTLSWVASDESFFPFKNVITTFRPRGAFGVSGVPPKPEATNRVFERVDGNPTGALEPLYGQMLNLKYLGNTRLKPERGTEIETGFDLEMWGGRMALYATHWTKKRKNAIVRDNFAGSVAGSGNTDMNVGDIRNSGFEMTLDVRASEHPMFGLQFNTLISRLRSRVERVNSSGALSVGYPGISGIRRAETRYVVGYPAEGVWEIPIQGYADLDGNGWITTNEYVLGGELRFVGSTDPNLQVAFTPRVDLLNRKVTVQGLFSYTDGQTQSLGTAANHIVPGINGTTPHESGVVQGADGFERQVAWITSSRTGFGFTQRVDILRFESMSVSTTISPRIARLLRAQSASVALMGKNLGIWTNYIGVDPNVNGTYGGHGLADTGQLPSPREWRLDFRLRY